MFQGAESDPARPSSRVLQPPGGSSSDLFGSAEVSPLSSKSQKMASNIFAAAEEPMNFPKRTNPPGGKDSGIFEDHKPNASRQFINPPGGKTSNIFGTPSPVSAVKAHPNKPKDHTFLLNDRGDSPRETKAGKAFLKASIAYNKFQINPELCYQLQRPSGKLCRLQKKWVEVCEAWLQLSEVPIPVPIPVPVPVPVDQRPQREELSVKKDLPKETIKEPGPKIDDHEPRLGPRPRSHNKVLNPPGGKSSIAFY